MLSYHTLFLGSQCNNRCSTCVVKGEQEIRELNVLLNEVDALADPENIELRGGEPTMYTDLFPLISHARGRGARRIKLATNGCNLADWDLLTRLLEAGCRLFEVKIYGSRPEIHEAITGVKGSFDATLQGLQNLGRVSNSGGHEDNAYVSARVALTQVNLEELIDTVAFLVSFGIDRIVIARASSDFPMTEGAQTVANAMRVATLNRTWSTCEGFPPCLMKGSEMHLAEFLKPTATRGEKPKGCHRCAYGHICSGPPEDYVDDHGLREFRSVSESPHLHDLNRLLETRRPLDAEQ